MELITRSETRLLERVFLGVGCGVLSSWGFLGIGGGFGKFLVLLFLPLGSSFFWR